MKIGFVGNLYGTAKGHSYVVKDMINALKNDNHNILMYRIRTNSISEEFPMPDDLTSEEFHIIQKDNFIKWLDEKKPDACIFMEYAQWWTEDHDKVAICKERGIKTVGFLVYEKLDWNKTEHYKKYDKILCPTGFQTKLMRKHGIVNAVHIKWGVDFDEINDVATPEKDNNKVIFYHCAGSGGVDNRKNTDAIIKAYEMIRDENTDFIITHLGKKIFAKKEILAFTKLSDVLINTAKWDSIGLNTLEANACGRPVIVCDMDPVNELVQNNINGLLVEGSITTSEYVTCPVCEVNIEKLAQAMNMCKNKLILDTLKNNAKKFAEMNFNWKENQKDFLKIFR